MSDELENAEQTEWERREEQRKQVTLMAKDALIASYETEITELKSQLASLRARPQEPGDLISRLLKTVGDEAERMLANKKSCVGFSSEGCTACRDTDPYVRALNFVTNLLLESEPAPSVPLSDPKEISKEILEAAGMTNVVRAGAGFGFKVPEHGRWRFEAAAILLRESLDSIIAEISPPSAGVGLDQTAKIAGAEYLRDRILESGPPIRGPLSDPDWKALAEKYRSALVDVDVYLANDPEVWRLSSVAKAGDVLCDILGAESIQAINAQVYANLCAKCQEENPESRGPLSDEPRENENKDGAAPSVGELEPMMILRGELCSLAAVARVAGLMDAYYAHNTAINAIDRILSGAAE